MKNRNGEKIGWTGGWLGGFIWVAILALIFLFQQKWAKGLSGLVLVCLAVFFILSCAPWRRPDVIYWKLMVPVYIVFFLSAAWAVWSYGGLKAIGLNWWNVFWILPLLMPLGTAGRRTWNNSAPNR